MKKVFIIHGLAGKPNGGWRPWLMAELAKLDVYACALSMPSPEDPRRDEWVDEIARHAAANRSDEIFLVGHSLGVPAILHFLERTPDGFTVSGTVLVSGRCEPTDDAKLAHFFEPPFDLAKIRTRSKAFAIIHGDDDAVVPVRNAEILSAELHGTLTLVPHGGHLNSSDGWRSLPQCLDALAQMMK